MPEIITPGLLIEFSRVCMNPRSNSYIVDFVSYFFLLWYSGNRGELQGTSHQFHGKYILAPPYPNVSLILKCDIDSIQYQ